MPGTTDNIKRLIKILGALIVSFIIINAISFVYNHDPKWLKRDGGATEGVYAPGHFVFRTDEGFGYSDIDENGYVNRISDIGRGYVLAFGKSHTNAMEVMAGERYVDLLDEMLFKTQGRHAYAVARGGNTFADLLCGFNALVAEFPDSSAVIIEMTCLDSSEEYEAALNQREYNEQMKAAYLMSHESTKQRIEGWVKEYFPAVAYFINYKLPLINIYDRNAFFQADEKASQSISTNADSERVENALNEALHLIRTEYDGRIIVLYHPGISLERDGNMKINIIPEYEILAKCCNNNGIDLCYMGDEYLEAYNSNRIVPYGFWNTSMGEGHLNSQGHKLIADVLFNNYINKG